MIKFTIIISAALAWLALAASQARAAERVYRLGARPPQAGAPRFLAGAGAMEGALFFVAGAETFGGRKGFGDLGAAFNKKFGLNTRINFAAGPEMNSMAARVITEVKAGRASTDFYLGSQ